MNRFLKPQIAAQILLILVGATIAIRGMVLGINVLNLEVFRGVEKILSLLLLVGWVVVWLAFRRLLKQLVPSHHTDPLIPLIIGMLVFHLVSYPVLSLSYSVSLMNSIWLANIALYIIFAIRIMRLPHTLFGYRESYGGSLIAYQLSEALLFGMLTLEFIAGFSYTWYNILSTLPLILNLFNMIVLYRIFSYAAKNPHTAGNNPMDSLINKIGKTPPGPD